MALPKLYDRTTWHNNTTPALNEDNLNAMSQAIDDIDDRLIGLAGTIMEDVPQIIEDMEILGPAVENIDTNVARAEGAADDAEAEALKSEGYALGTQDGVEVTSGEYYQNNAKYYAEIANPPIENTVDFTDIIAISDAINKAAKDVKLKVEAVQDLHGYTKPWGGGVGKNLLPMVLSDIKAANTTGTWSGNVYTISNGTITVQTDSNGNVIGIKVNGSFNSTITFALMSSANLGITGILNGAPATGSASTYELQVALTESTYRDYGSGSSAFNWNENVKAYLVLRSGYSAPSNGIVFTPMFRLSTVTDATFEPYSNISPITGHSEAKVTRVAHNLLPLSLAEMKTLNTAGTWSGNTYTRSNKTFTVNTDGDGAVISIVLGGTASANTELVLHRGYDFPSGNYTFSKGNTSATQFYINKLSGSGHQNVGSLAAITTGGEATREVDYSNYDHLVYGIFCASGNALTDIFEPMVRLSTDTESSFEPYNGTIYTIDLDGTRYGGVLDVTSGVLTLTHKFKRLTSVVAKASGPLNNIFYNTEVQSEVKKTSSSSDVLNAISNAFPVISESSILNSDVVAICGYTTGIIGIAFGFNGYTTTTEVNTFLTNNEVDLVYLLATPQTIQLTAEEVELLYGYNTLFGDCGDISLTYDASGIIHIAEAKLDIDTFKSIVAASSDFADFKTRVAAL